MGHLIIDDYQAARETLIELARQVHQAREILSDQKEKSRGQTEEFIFIRDGNVIRRLKVDDILYAEAMGDYVKLCTSQKLYMIHSRLKNVEERLPQTNFLRVHRSYIVALNKIDFLQDATLNIDGRFLPVADPYRKILSQRMNVL